jgi:hypothetical protein
LDGFEYFHAGGVMRGVVRWSGAGGWLFPIGLLVFSLLPSGALAQSSVGRAANTATGASLLDAVEQQQNELIQSSGVGSSSGGVGAAIGAGASPTGRLRSSDHDVLKVADPTDNFAWSTKEASVFGTGVYTLPGTVLGGQMKVSIFGGHNWLSLEMKNGGGAIAPLDADQFGKARNESVIVGGTALWSQKNTYALATFVGMWGDTSLTDSIDDCGVLPAPNTCAIHKYNFNTSGFIGTLTAGQVFPLSKSGTGPMLDLRGSVSYTQSMSDPFLNTHFDLVNNSRQEQTYKFSTWTATAAATLFSNITLQNSALLRPYIQGYVRQEIGYNNKLLVIDQDPTVDPVMVHFDQAHTYGGVDVGATYTLGNMTLGAAAYFDGSADERTFGGRLGASWKLN